MTRAFSAMTNVTGQSQRGTTMSDANQRLADVPARQVPGPGESVLDHIGIFGPDFASACRAFTRLGFTLTPENRHTQPGSDGKTLVPAGTGNQCVMFELGYLEILAATGEDTPLARQLKAGQARYSGLHLIAYGVADAAALHTDMAKRGFDPGPLVRLQRPAQTETGEKTARFSVVRLAPDVAREGRVQAVQHHTADLVWQARFLDHANGAVALVGILICVDNPAEAAGRFSRFLGCDSAAANGGVDLGSARGRTTFIRTGDLGARIRGLVAPTSPFMAAMGIAVRDLAKTASMLSRAGVKTADLGGHRLLVGRDDALGAAIVFHKVGVEPWA